MRPLNLVIKPSRTLKWFLSLLTLIVIFSLLYAAKLRHDYLSFIFILFIPVCGWNLHQYIELYSYLNKPISVIQLGCRGEQWWLQTRTGQKSAIKSFKNSFYFGKLAILNVSTKEFQTSIVLMNESLTDDEWLQFTKYIRLKVSSDKSDGF